MLKTHALKSEHFLGAIADQGPKVHDFLGQLVRVEGFYFCLQRDKRLLQRRMALNLICRAFQAGVPDEFAVFA